jgi:hypothetical protein
LKRDGEPFSSVSLINPREGVLSADVCTAFLARHRDEADYNGDISELANRQFANLRGADRPSAAVDFDHLCPRPNVPRPETSVNGSSSRALTVTSEL